MEPQLERLEQGRLNPARRIAGEGARPFAQGFERVASGVEKRVFGVGPRILTFWLTIRSKIRCLRNCETVRTCGRRFRRWLPLRQAAVWICVTDFPAFSLESGRIGEMKGGCLESGGAGGSGGLSGRLEARLPRRQGWPSSVSGRWPVLCRSQGSGGTGNFGADGKNDLDPPRRCGRCGNDEWTSKNCRRADQDRTDRTSGELIGWTGRP